MTNAGLKALIAEFGDRIFCFTLNNNHKIFVNLTGDADNPAQRNHVPRTDEFLFKTTADGDDLFGVPRVNKTWGPKEIAYTTWIRTALIEIVMTLDDPDCMDIPDINGLM